MMDSDAVIRRIAEIGIVPVVRLDEPDGDALPLADALCAGGVPLAEVTFRAEGAECAIAAMKAAHPEMIVGAGTVLCEEHIDTALDAGADFIVTPGFDAALVRYAIERKVPIFPGCTTATDYHAAYRMGLSVLKFFPAELSGGVAKIKALSAPFPMFRVMPTGGISLGNLAEYISCPVVCACGGSYMVTPALIGGKKWDDISALCRRSVEVIREARAK